MVTMKNIFFSSGKQKYAKVKPIGFFSVMFEQERKCPSEIQTHFYHIWLLIIQTNHGPC